MACLGSPISTRRHVVRRRARRMTLPLHRVGVLELVDHHDRPAPAHPVAGRGVVGLERDREPGEQVVEAEHAEQPLAALQLGEDVVGERAADPGGGLGRRVDRREPRARVADHLVRELQGLGAGELGCVLHVAEALEVEVVDDLADELVEVLDQGDSGVGVAGHAERTQDQLAELVGGRDRRGVEAGQGVLQPQPAVGQLLGRAADEVAQQVVVGRARVVEGLGGPDQLVADPLAQLLARRPAEGDEEHVVEQGLALRDVAGHERRERVGLAGAGTGLEHRGGGSRRQRVEEIEGSGPHIGPRSLSSSGNQSRSARAGSPARTSRSACSPQTRTWAGSASSPG